MTKVVLPFLNHKPDLESLDTILGVTILH